jgi:hypothetical protein
VTIGAIYTLRTLRRNWARGDNVPTPYGPEHEREPAAVR